MHALGVAGARAVPTAAGLVSFVTLLLVEGGCAPPNRTGSSGSGGATRTEGQQGGSPSGSMGTGGAGGARDAGAAPSDTLRATKPAMSGLTVEANPNNALSCFVRFTTDQPATAEVHFGVDNYRYRVIDDESGIDHRVLLIGMRAETSYLIKAIASNAAGSSEGQTTFTTGALPEGLPVASVQTADTGDADAGWTLANIMPAARGVGFGGTVPGIMVMYDIEGFPVWYFVNGSSADARGDVSVRALPGGNILLGPSSGEPAKEIDLAGNVVWRGPEQPPSNASASDPATAPMSHFANKLANGNYVVLRDLTNDSGIGGALVEELSPRNEVVWSWNLFDYLSPPPSAMEDWCHPNSVTIDLAQDVLYLSCRFQGVIKAKRSGDRAVLWVLGGEEGGDFSFDPASASFKDQHDPEIHDDGTVLIYSNGGSSTPAPPGVTSKVLELRLDEQARTAKATFEFPGSFNVDSWYKTWYTPFWGDANRLRNGNILVVAGVRSPSGQTRIFEVRPTDGRVVWAISLPPGVGSYQAARLPPRVEAL